MGGFNVNIPGINFSPEMLQNIQRGAQMAPLQSLLNQLNQGTYVYGDASQAFRSGLITQDQLNQFTEAFNQATGTTPGNRPFSVGQVVSTGPAPTPAPSAPGAAAAPAPTPASYTGQAAMDLTGDPDMDRMILDARAAQDNQRNYTATQEMIASGVLPSDFVYGMPGGKPGFLEIGINSEGVKGPNYQVIPYNTPQEYLDAYNLKLQTESPRESWTDQRSSFGKFVDETLGGPAGLFGLTVGALTGGLGYAGMLGSAGAGAAAGAGTAAITGGDPLRAGLAGGAGGILGSGANALLGGPTQGAVATGTTTPAASASGTAAAGAGGTVTPGTAASTGAINIGAGTGAVSPAAGSINLGAGQVGGVLGGGAGAVSTSAPLTMGGLVGGVSPAAGSINLGAGLGAAGAGAAGAAGAGGATGGLLGGVAPATGGAAATGGAGAINIGAGTGALSPAAGSINLGAGQAGGVLGGGAGAASTGGALTMGGLVGGTSPAAGSINLGAGLGAAGAGLGTAAGGAGMGGVSGLISGAQNLAGNIGSFVGSPLGQGLLQLGQAGLGYMSGQEQADLARELAAQAQFRPYNVQGPLGAVNVQGQDISISPTEQQRQLQQGLFGAAQQQLGVAGAPALQGIVSRTPSQVEQLAQSFIGQTTRVPAAADELRRTLAGMQASAQGMGISGIQQAYGAPSAMQTLQGQPMGAAYQAAPGSVGMTAGLLGQAPQAGMLSARGAVSGLLGGAAPGVAGMGAGALGGALARSREEGLVSQAAGAGLGLLAEGAAGARGLAGEIAGAGGELLRGAQAPSFNQLAAERLSALRGQARTGEERATQSAIERLFSQGRLGTTGGQRALGELARAQEEADIARTVAAQDFAQQQQNIAAQQALQRQQLGAGLLGTGLAGQQFLAQQGQGLLGMGAQVGQFGRTLGADIGQFGVGLGEQARQADIRNILAATGQDVSQLQFGATLGEQQRAQNLQALLAAQAQDIGQRQFGATFAEQQRQANLEAQLAAVQADQLRAARLGQLGQGLFGLGAEIPSVIFEAQRAADQASLSRGAQRVAAAEGLFGFGQQAQQQALQQAIAAGQAQAGLYSPLIQLANIASGMGSAQATGAANAADLRYGAFNSPYSAASTYLGSLIT